jgi:hypothetical protein
MKVLFLNPPDMNKVYDYAPDEKLIIEFIQKYRNTTLKDRSKVMINNVGC